MRQTFSIVMLQYSQWSKEAVEMPWREEFSRKCRKLFTSMGISQIAFKEH